MIFSAVAVEVVQLLLGGSAAPAREQYSCCYGAVQLDPDRGSTSE
jgi:hypothetical protein